MDAADVAVASRDCVVLVDMDGVICDFEAQFLQRWRKTHPSARWIPTEARTSHYVDQDASGAYDTRRSHAIIMSPGFYDSMPPIPGALDALREMQAEGLRVCICTAPFGRGETAANCEAEKRAWVKSHLGEDWLTPERFICIKDKTLVPGKLLIDDKPNPSSHWSGGLAREPSWQHVVFTQPFNLEAAECRDTPRLACWSEWREILQPLL
mmetsp:Transcript_149008/g.285472  ORF Transcript_149008/g.285472 Transcript_149008/m.285472 type:complete len:210 (+) Transcript_149008:85-714(+)